jgi:hypothetical protein
MPIDINLLSKKRRKDNTKGVVSKMAIVLLVVFSLYFFSTTVWVVYRLFSLNREIAFVDAETIKLSDDIRAKNDIATKYVLSKNILDFFETLQKSKFHYKLYLDQIVELVPSTVFLKNVDFANKGWISVSFQVPNHVVLKLFEDIISRTDLIEKTAFGSMYVEGVSRDKTGQYVIKMQFAIKNNV